MTSDPPGYCFAPAPSAFPNHVGRLLHGEREGPDGRSEPWTAMRVEAQHVNAWGRAHGGFIAFLAEASSATAAWDPSGPPVVTITLSIQFIRAPKLGDLIEARARMTGRTRSLVFVDVHAFVGDELQFTASAVNKIIVAPAIVPA